MVASVVVESNVGSKGVLVVLLVAVGRRCDRRIGCCLGGSLGDR